MTASSATVLANLAYLIGAVVVAVILGLLVWLKHRKPKSVDANMASFRRGLSALAPDEGPSPLIRRTEPIRIRPTGLTHVKLEPARIPAPADDQPADSDDHEGGSAG